MTTSEAYRLRDAGIGARAATSNTSEVNRLTGFILALELVLGLSSRIDTETVAYAHVRDVMRGEAQEWAERRRT